MQTRFLAVAVTIAVSAVAPAPFIASDAIAQGPHPASAPGGGTPVISSLVRGNAPGEWRYWGGDAHSSRYSPLDQINASNFGTLQQAWQWNAGTFGPDEYYRTTPLYANGRLFTVATTRRSVMAIDPETGETL